MTPAAVQSNRRSSSSIDVSRGFDKRPISSKSAFADESTVGGVPAPKSLHRSRISRAHAIASLTRKRAQMLRGLTTVSFFADDIEAAKKWYVELLGIDPYFERPIDGRAAYIEFRIGDYQHELGIIDSRYSPHGSTSPAGAVVYWHVDDLDATYQKLLSMGAKENEAPVVRGEGFVTASVVDPFGNVLGIMSNPRYLEVLGSTSTA
jgi:predicted enzyme related to lactoylglutathione lyase